MKNLTQLLVAAALAVLPLFNAYAGDSRVEQIDQKQRILERKWELQEEKTKDQALVGAGKEGFYIKSADGKFNLKLRGLIQADSRQFVNVPEGLGTNTFVLRKARPIFEGTVFDRFSFAIVPDFGSGAAVLQDAYVDAKITPWFKLRGGKFKAPVGLERLQSDPANLFLERGYPSGILPNRDIGFEILGDIKDGIVSYAAGVFNGVSDGSLADADTNDGKDLAGRIFVQPFLKSSTFLKELGIGFGGTYGHQKGSTTSPNLPTYRTGNGQLTFFRYANTGATLTVADGKVYRYSPQAYYYWGPFGVLGEYARSTQTVSNTASGQTTLTNQAWLVESSYVLTGDKASFKGVKPKKPFNPKEGKWGAVELVVRAGELKIDPDAFPSYALATASAKRARSYGVGANWYLNDNVKLATDYEHTLFKNGSTTGDRPPEHVVSSRLELSF